MPQTIDNMVATWNNAATTFTFLKANVTDTASASGSLLMDLQVGGTSQLRVSKSGIASVGYGFLASCAGGIGNTFIDVGVTRAGVTFWSGGSIVWSSSTTVSGSVDLFLTRRAAANLRLGAADAAAPVAQTLSVQSVVAGTADTAGANLTITGSQGTGTGAGGSIVFQTAPAGLTGTAQNALVTRWSIKSTGTLLPNGNSIGELGNRVTSIYFPSNGSLLFQDASRIVAQSSGFILQDWAGTAFGLLSFGGTTSSFPALKRSSTTLQARLADDSAFANIEAAQVVTPTQTLTDAATITFNANISAVVEVTLTATGRTLTPSNLKAGGSYLLFIKQDATGGKTITTWTNFKWPGGVAPTLSTAANAVDIISGISDGTFIYASIQNGFA